MAHVCGTQSFITVFTITYPEPDESILPPPYI